MIAQLLAGPRPRVQIRRFLILAIPAVTAGVILFLLGQLVAAVAADTLMLMALAVTSSRCWFYLDRRRLWISGRHRIAFALVDVLFWSLAALSFGSLMVLLGLSAGPWPAALRFGLIVVAAGGAMTLASLVKP